MRALSVDRALRLPLRLHGIELGRPVDVLLDRVDWRPLGFEIRCSDGSARFLPFATANVRDDEIAIASALLLLEEVDFYRDRSASFRDLLGAPVGAGVLRDLVVAPDGTIAELVVEEGARVRRLPPAVVRGRAA